MSRIVAIVLLGVCMFSVGPVCGAQELVAKYTGMREKLRLEIKAKVLPVDAAKQRAFAQAAKAVNTAYGEAQKAKTEAQKAKREARKDKDKWQHHIQCQATLKVVEEAYTKAKASMLLLQKELGIVAFLASDELDAKLVKCVVLTDATPEGLAAYAEQGEEQAALVAQLLADTDLMKMMLLADGPEASRVGRGDGPAQYGPAMKIYTGIQKASSKADKGILQRLAIAVSLVHAVPVVQGNPKDAVNAPQHVDPVKRYLHYEKAYLAGELDPGFKKLTTFDLRFVISAKEPDETLAWGREMLRNYRPEHIFNRNEGERYVGIVKSDVRYGSGDVQYDRPELQATQNILMNGGICGRQAFFGRFILRAFGIPNIARPQKGHASMARWTSKGWITRLGGKWGVGWTMTPYKKDLTFLATTQARVNQKGFLQVKRAQWVGEVLGEKRIYGNPGNKGEFWNSVSLNTQRTVIDDSEAIVLASLGEDIGESNAMTAAQKAMARPDTPGNRKIVYGDDGTITVPAAAYSKPSGKTKEVLVMKSFEGGLQVFFPRFKLQGFTIMRGGAWGGSADSCGAGWRILGYSRRTNWGFRVAMTPPKGETAKELTLDLGDGMTMEFVYIKPGTFIMGGTTQKKSKLHLEDVPKHEVTLTKGYYMGKYEVTQEQYQKIVGSNPSSRANRHPKCPVDNLDEGQVLTFCDKLAAKTGKATRLPTEAEWEYACRAGSTTKYFFGDDPAKLDAYAWYDKNDGGKSHPVGQKKPNPWGLYDILGNVFERVSDRYSPDYYKRSPKKDPTGMSQSDKSLTEYKIKVAKAGQYAMTAEVVTANYDQKFVVSANGGVEQTMVMPFTLGKWQVCEPVTLTLKAGENTLNLLRREAPQYGVAVKDFVLKPVE